jgi:hypothetical protein
VSAPSSLPWKRPPGNSGLPRRSGLAAERRRLKAEAARKAQEERERKERKEAGALARQRAEEEAREVRMRADQEAREAAERECRRLEQERLDGRALLANFVATYGKVPGCKVKYRSPDKAAAREQAMRHFGLYKSDNEQKPSSWTPPVLIIEGVPGRPE